jgi:hypothetical protein
MLDGIHKMMKSLHMDDLDIIICHLSFFVINHYSFEDIEQFLLGDFAIIVLICLFKKSIDIFVSYCLFCTARTVAIYCIGNDCLDFLWF